LNKWYKINELKTLVHIVVATRNGHDEKIDDFKSLNLDIDISSTKLRESLDLKYIPNAIKDDILSLQKEKGHNS